MSNVFKAILVLACVSVVWAAQNDKGDTTSEQQRIIERSIMEVHAAMMKAAENLDAEALYSHVLDMNKGVIVQDGRVLKTREEALSATKQGLQGLKDISYTYNQKHITVISPTVALWVADGTTSATIIEDGREINVPFAETIVFVQKDGRWKVLHAHRSVPNPQ